MMEGETGYKPAAWEKAIAEALCSCMRCQGVVQRTIRDSKKRDGLVLWGLSGSERSLAVELGAMATGQRFGRGHGRPHDCPARR